MPPPQPISRMRKSDRQPICLRVAPEMGRDLIADIGEPHRIELVQHRHRAALVPPLRGKLRKLLDFGPVDGRLVAPGLGIAMSLAFQIRTEPSARQRPDPAFQVNLDRPPADRSSHFAESGRVAGGSSRRYECAAAPGASARRRMRVNCVPGRRSFHVTSRAEIRRNVGRRYRPHPQRRAPCAARIQRRPRRGRCGLRHGRQDQRARGLVPRRLADARRARIRCHRVVGRERDRGTACNRAAKYGHHRALLAGLAIADVHLERAWLRPHRRSERLGAGQALPRAQGSRRDRGLPGHPQGDRPHHHARPRRLGYLGGCDRGCDRGRPLRHLHRCRRRLHHRSARGAEGAASRQGRVRGNAGTGLARRQGAAGALGRAWHGAQGQDLRALELRQAGRHRSARHAARHADLRRGGYRGATGRHRHRLLQGRGADFDPQCRGQAGHRGCDLRAARRIPASMST